MIIFHISNSSITLRNNSNLFIQSFFAIGEIAVDLFCFLSGMTLIVALLRTNRENHSWKRWYKKRAIRIFPLLIITTFFYIWGQYFLNGKIYDINSVLIHISGLQSIPTNPDFFIIFSVHWYITFILTCYLIFPILHFFIENHFKLTAIIGIIFYVLFILFHPSLYEISDKVINILFQKNLLEIGYYLFIPRYFDFLFGMLLGFWIGKNHMKNLKILQKEKKIGWISFTSLCVISIIYLIFHDFYIKNREIYFISNYERILCFPLMTIFITIFCVYFFSNKTKINRILEIPGKESYEIYLIHVIPILIFFYMIFNILLLPDTIMYCFISIPIIIVVCIIFSYPFYYLGDWLKNKEKYHNIIITICLSLIIYATIVLLFNPEFVNINSYSIILYCSILIILITIICTKNLISNHKTLKSNI